MTNEDYNRLVAIVETFLKSGMRHEAFHDYFSVAIAKAGGIEKFGEVPPMDGWEERDFMQGLHKEKSHWWPPKEAPPGPGQPGGAREEVDYAKLPPAERLTAFRQQQVAKEGHRPS
jgi:hypothetical protein